MSNEAFYEAVDAIDTDIVYQELSLDADDDIDMSSPEEVNMYVSGYRAAGLMLEEDETDDRLKSIDEYMAMETATDAYSNGWKDGVTEYFFEMSGL